ncbi:MAG TPA: hypothetical protein VG389_01045 [Myxococcota bacterium]|jgi:hypothetical protein|nr:hypothetical protein [Myxococcota bacterium]
MRATRIIGFATGVALAAVPWLSFAAGDDAPASGPASAPAPATAAPVSAVLPAPAPDAAPAADDKVPLGLVAGVEGGVTLSQPFSALGVSPAVAVHLGYLLPPLERRLGVFAAVGYAVPRASGSGEDVRLTAGTYDWEVRQKELAVSLGVVARLLPPFSSMLNGYLAAAGRAFLLQTVEEASAGGMPFGVNRETGTRFGFHLALGGELYLGPGAVFLEAQLDWTRLDGRLTGTASGGALGFVAGYRLIH